MLQIPLMAALDVTLPTHYLLLFIDSLYLAFNILLIYFAGKRLCHGIDQGVGLSPVYQPCRSQI